jgi:hypothetical protein
MAVQSPLLTVFTKDEMQNYIINCIKENRWENVLESIQDDSYDTYDVATQKSIDLLLKKAFIQNKVFAPCEHAVFGEDRYDGILVTITTSKTTDSFCLSGRLLRNIGDPDYIEGCLTKKGIRWID